MKKWLLVILAVIVMGLVVFSFSDYHTKRNQWNQLPVGILTQVDGVNYKDEAGKVWILQSHFKNQLHQPDEPIHLADKPYLNIQGDINYDSENSNLKFLMMHESGGSSEVIVKPNGTFLTTGSKRATYNYYHPEGFIGMTMHTIVDVIPHFINDSYSE